MLYLAGTDPLALAVEKAIHTGDVPALKRLLTAHPELAQARIDLNWLPPWEKLTPLDAAQRRQADDLVAWLRTQGAQSAQEL